MALLNTPKLCDILSLLNNRLSEVLYKKELKRLWQLTGIERASLVFERTYPYKNIVRYRPHWF